MWRGSRAQLQFGLCQAEHLSPNSWLNWSVWMQTHLDDLVCLEYSQMSPTVRASSLAFEFDYSQLFLALLEHFGSAKFGGLSFLLADSSDDIWMLAMPPLYLLVYYLGFLISLVEERMLLSRLDVLDWMGHLSSDFVLIGEHHNF